MAGSAHLGSFHSAAVALSTRRPAALQTGRDGERRGETGRDGERRGETGRDGERRGETAGETPLERLSADCF